jgi:hypothetical protein
MARHLDRYHAIQLGIPCPPDDTKCPSTYLIEQFELLNSPGWTFPQLARLVGGGIAMSSGKCLHVLLVNIDKSELVAAAGAIDTLIVRIIDQLDVTLAMGTFNLHC